MGGIELSHIFLGSRYKRLNTLLTQCYHILYEHPTLTPTGSPRRATRRQVGSRPCVTGRPVWSASVCSVRLLVCGSDVDGREFGGGGTPQPLGSRSSDDGRAPSIFHSAPSRPDPVPPKEGTGACSRHRMRFPGSRSEFSRDRGSCGRGRGHGLTFGRGWARRSGWHAPAARGRATSGLAPAQAQRRSSAATTHEG